MTAVGSVALSEHGKAAVGSKMRRGGSPKKAIKRLRRKAVATLRQARLTAQLELVAAEATAAQLRERALEAAANETARCGPRRTPSSPGCSSRAGSKPPRPLEHRATAEAEARALLAEAELKASRIVRDAKPRAARDTTRSWPKRCRRRRRSAARRPTRSPDSFVVSTTSGPGCSRPARRGGAGGHRRACFVGDRCGTAPRRDRAGAGAQGSSGARRRRRGEPPDPRTRGRPRPRPSATKPTRSPRSRPSTPRPHRARPLPSPRRRRTLRPTRPRRRSRRRSEPATPRCPPPRRRAPRRTIPIRSAGAPRATSPPRRSRSHPRRRSRRTVSSPTGPRTTPRRRAQRRGRRAEERRHFVPGRHRRAGTGTVTLSGVTATGARAPKAKRRWRIFGRAG